MALINAGKTAEARALLEKLAAASNTPDPAIVYLLAEAQRADQDLPAAEATARKLLAAHPATRGGCTCSRSSSRIGATPRPPRRRSVISCTGAGRRDALNSLGYMLAERGDRLDEAVQLLQRALKIDPENPSYLDSLGWAYFQQGKSARPTSR